MDIFDFLFQICAVGLGAFFGFWADSYREGLGEKKETVRILRLLREELQKNLTIMEVIRKNLYEFLYPSSHFSSTMFQAVSGRLHLVNDPNNTLLTKITRAYYNFDTFEKALQLFKDQMLTSLLVTNEKTRDDMAEHIKGLQQVMLSHVLQSEDGDDMITFTNDAISGIDGEIRRLDC
jgi:hypothetical protein